MGYLVAQVIQAIVQSLGNVLGKAPNEANLFEGYTQLCLAIDEIINEVEFLIMELCTIAFPVLEYDMSEVQE